MVVVQRQPDVRVHSSLLRSSLYSSAPLAMHHNVAVLVLLVLHMLRPVNKVSGMYGCLSGKAVAPITSPRCLILFRARLAWENLLQHADVVLWTYGDTCCCICICFPPNGIQNSCLFVTWLHLTPKTSSWIYSQSTLRTCHRQHVLGECSAICFVTAMRLPEPDVMK
jgi:hypothetical protein